MEKINKVEKKQKMAGKTAPFEVNSCLLFPAENQQVQVYLILKRKKNAFYLTYSDVWW